MDKAKGQPELFNILTEDVSSRLVDDLLARQHETELFMTVSLAEWEALSLSHPELSHYIAMTAFEVSKGDPLQRERIAASLLGMYRMLDQDITVKVQDARQRQSRLRPPHPKLLDANAGYDADEVQRPAA